ncbi:MAG TPA: asparagine synthase (glutamine-hydrolyzing) [Steroidobacteraceae bacterium]|nr:asparagine synthase (glutamine-hydrolyzing) [Steroidobacteraceae bacterium]
MCGIAGVYAPQNRLNADLVIPMLASMAHRGPDDRGVQVLSEGELVLGHLRLSILDLSAQGHQPMSTPDGSISIVYNGEVYNFREIRSQLQGSGWSFHSDSDTEVILAAYHTWGLGAVDRFRGMFAFALWDDRSKRLHLCRDRFGVKPLYFSIRNGRLAFASEMKGLISGGYTLRTPDPAAVAEYLQYGYTCAPRSIFADVHTVQPGTVCTVDTRLNVVEHRYWSAADLYASAPAAALRHELSELREEELLERVEHALQTAFSYRMVADVPVGVFLSGGIDSSLVATLLVRRAGFKLKTFTIGFAGSEFDESRYARAVADALGAEHIEFPVSAQAVLDTVSEVVDIADEPIGDSSLIPTLMVSRLARPHVKVALSADGADELFGGYARYAYCGNFVQCSRLGHSLYWLSAGLLDSLPPRLVARAYTLARAGGPRFAGVSDKLRKFVRMSRQREEFAAYDATVSEWAPQQVRSLVGRPPAGLGSASAAYRSVTSADPRDRFMHFDMTRYLPGDLLVKVDRASMAVSLEAREPFLDHVAAAVAAALPMSWKVRGAQNKYVLRRLLARHLPAGLFDRPKQGFSAPVGRWLRGPLRAQLLAELSASRVHEWGMLDPAAVAAETSRFLAADGRSGTAAGIWILFQLQRWADRWLRQPAQEQLRRAYPDSARDATSR